MKEAFVETLQGFGVIVVFALVVVAVYWMFASASGSKKK